MLISVLQSTTKLLQFFRSCILNLRKKVAGEKESGKKPGNKNVGKKVPIF